MKKPIVMVGIGEMAGVFARGFLRLGHPVYPVTRAQPIEAVMHSLPDPELVLVAVAENDLQPVLAQIPAVWSRHLGLLQNELLPKDWEGFPQSTVISVWFEKKRGMDHKVLIPSPVYGPKAQLIADALASLQIPTRVLGDSHELLRELVVKNLYILTTNIAGLRTGGTVGELWEHHQDFARRVAGEVIDLQEALTGRRFEQEPLIQAMLTAFEGDLQHKCMGRSAPARLNRALEQADRLGLYLPTLRELRAAQA